MLCAPAQVTIKTFDGVKTAKTNVGEPLMKAVGTKAGLKYGCKEGQCGSCEVKMDGRVVRTCVAKVPAKAKISIDVTQNKILKGRKNSNW